MKKVSILIPCYNEEDNVIPMSEAIVNLFTTQLTQYDYELVFIDNDSKDTTRPKLRKICEKILTSKRFSMRKISGSLIRPITAFSRPPETARFPWCAIFRIPLS